MRTSEPSPPPAPTPICCSSLHSRVLNEDEAADLATVLKALAEPIRLRLVSIIASADSGEVCACDFPALVERSQPTVSHHLAQLTKAGILEREKRGKWAWYRVNQSQLEQLRLALASIPQGAALKPSSHQSPASMTGVDEQR